MGKDDEIAQLRNEKKVLQEELDVVKVIAGQLNDLQRSFGRYQRNPKFPNRHDGFGCRFFTRRIE